MTKLRLCIFGKSITEVMCPFQYITAEVRDADTAY